MQWNWQRTGWPDFTWQKRRLTRAEAHFLLGGAVIVGAVKHLGAADNEQYPCR